MRLREPTRDCPLCPRLVEFRAHHRTLEPGWHNAPVPSFGPADARLLIVGLAPGLRGANRTGRPFTGDYAGLVLYPALIRYGFAQGDFREDPDDGLELVNCRITNAVRCVPPQNKPTGIEIRVCRSFLLDELLGATPPSDILVLGRIAHDSVVRALGVKLSDTPFGHGHVTELEGDRRLWSSYHCSRYNVNTGRLTEAMFLSVVQRIAEHPST